MRMGQEKGGGSPRRKSPDYYLGNVNNNEGDEG